MTSNETILKELESIAPTLAGDIRQMPYAVPVDHFETFPLRMLDRVFALSQEKSVPAGYFDSFAESMLARVRNREVTDELEQIAPLLNSIPKQMPYDVPDGYFETLNPAIPARSAKVVAFGGGKWKQWAAAAAIIFTLGITWLMLDSRTDDKGGHIASEQQVDSLLLNIDGASMATYIHMDGSDDYEFLRTLFLANEDIESGLKSFSTEELKTYIDRYPQQEPGT
ncbi:MAG TPA: hypothetical protein VK907_01950 [Phnomibacter sp.]|nr:hypothetical protein [Phnomibacter sp.]